MDVGQRIFPQTFVVLPPQGVKQITTLAPAQGHGPFQDLLRIGEFSSVVRSGCLEDGRTVDVDMPTAGPRVWSVTVSAACDRERNARSHPYSRCSDLFSVFLA